MTASPAISYRSPLGRELAARAGTTPIAVMAAALLETAPECVGMGFAARVAVIDDVVRFWVQAAGSAEDSGGGA